MHPLRTRLRCSGYTIVAGLLMTRYTTRYMTPTGTRVQDKSACPKVGVALHLTETRQGHGSNVDEPPQLHTPFVLQRRIHVFPCSCPGRGSSICTHHIPDPADDSDTTAPSKGATRQHYAALRDAAGQQRVHTHQSPALLHVRVRHLPQREPAERMRTHTPRTAMGTWCAW